MGIIHLCLVCVIANAFSNYDPQTNHSSPVYIALTFDNVPDNMQNTIVNLLRRTSVIREQLEQRTIAKQRRSAQNPPTNISTLPPG